MVIIGSSSKLFWVVCMTTEIILNCVVISHSSCLHPPNRHQDVNFQQKANRFWEFKEQTKSWVEISLPFDLTSCIDGRCNKVGTIESAAKKQASYYIPQQENRTDHKDRVLEENQDEVLLLRRTSLTRMSEASVWVTGQSGSIYERFWNGVKWVIAPHELPTSAGQAVSVFIINQTILALSGSGILYQLQLDEDSRPLWNEIPLTSEPRNNRAKAEENTVQIKFAVVSDDEEILYFSTMNGSLLEVSQFQPLRWDNHGRPPGGDVSAIADTGTMRPGIVFTVSSTGDLYEFDKKSKPTWRKHIWSVASMGNISLIPSAGCAIHGFMGTHSQSLFLLTKDGFLIERRLHKRKWKWKVHGAPEGYYLSAMTPLQENENEEVLSLFFTTTTGLLFEYQLFKYSGVKQENQMEGLWLNHMHPQHAKIAKGVPGVHLQTGRILFALDDGRLAELHLSGIGGEASGPTHQISLRRKASSRYEWSILDAPETEGWNSEYCTVERGPSNCISGLKELLADDEINEESITIPPRRRKAQGHIHYISLATYDYVTESNNFITKSISANFRMRAMHADRSFFLTDSGQTFEYLYTDNIWMWLRHEHSTAMKGVLGNYNGSILLVDTYGNLIIRERSGNELSWVNCSAMKNGRQVTTGPPWDGLPGRNLRVTEEDALFFINKKGRLLQFTVALRKFKWKDCRSPPDTRIAFIVDQEDFRMNIVFVVGRDGRLYQYNRITELWHGHYQSPHLILSRSPGTTIRPSPQSLSGSLFMISKDGVLVEYNWNSFDGWEWVEHGRPYRDVVLVGAPGPCFDGNQLFVIASDGHVYRRHLDQRTWKWADHGYPNTENAGPEAWIRAREDKTDASRDSAGAQCTSKYNRNCNEKVSPVRPLKFSEDSMIFELQDGRLAELRRSGMTAVWEWTHIIGTPTSLCLIAVAS